VHFNRCVNGKNVDKPDIHHKMYDECLACLAAWKHNWAVSLLSPQADHTVLG